MSKARIDLVSRLRKERDELANRLARLSNWLAKLDVAKLGVSKGNADFYLEQTHSQMLAMQQYMTTLSTRISILESDQYDGELHFGYWRCDEKSLANIPDSLPLPPEVIPNHMGINLCSVDSITWARQDDGQLTHVTINLNPAKAD